MLGLSQSVFWLVNSIVDMEIRLVASKRGRPQMYMILQQQLQQ
jgi:hypothetical protein